MKNIWLFVGLAFALLVLAARCDPGHIPNVVPLGAFALWAGYYLNKRAALLLVAATLILSDAILGFYAWQVMAMVYLATLLYVPLGVAVYSVAQKRRERFAIVAPLVGAAMIGSVSFFLLTNGAVWYWGLQYPRTISGLGACLFAGLPFWRNSALGDLSGVAILFGSSSVLSVLLSGLKARRFGFRHS